MIGAKTSGYQTAESVRTWLAFVCVCAGWVYEVIYFDIYLNLDHMGEEARKLK